MYRPFCLVLWCAVLLILAAATGARAQVDPKALRQQQSEAITRGDVAGALALYADDAVIDGASLCVETPCANMAKTFLTPVGNSADSFLSA
jgi:hypothetical protein